MAIGIHGNLGKARSMKKMESLYQASFWSLRKGKPENRVKLTKLSKLEGSMTYWEQQERDAFATRASYEPDGGTSGKLFLSSILANPIAVSEHVGESWSEPRLAELMLVECGGTMNS